ncbi:hypothetical protein [Marilutibacter alkalisoli]|uniref:DUF1449 family protein n=1 Tax=Marilutibacter alkalisoli TaxID=2591633 RepID=A0A514BNA9_9GAMM|nr:hypothetical protein [Lysobacter alkalisoli]QDH68815.1 hypothetical protein FKV23_00825 [Lysobacter alkalisoli]
MEIFLQIVFSYPTVLFSILLAVAVGYWLLAALGLVEMEALDGWIAPDFDTVEVDGFAGALMKFGLGGLPLMLVFTVLVFFAWLLSYFADYLVLRHLPGGWLRLLTGSGVMLGAFVAAVPVTSVVLRPVRKMFEKLRPAPIRSLLGMAGVVRSSVVDARQGTANVEDGGAGLILQVRNDSDGGRTFGRGDRIVLIEYLETENAYRVIGEDEFKGL